MTSLVPCLSVKNRLDDWHLSTRYAKETCWPVMSSLFGWMSVDQMPVGRMFLVKIRGADWTTRCQCHLTSSPFITLTLEKLTWLCPGIPYWTGRLSTVDLLIKIGCFVKNKNIVSIWKQLLWTSYYKEANSIDPSPSVWIPWCGPYRLYRRRFCL